MEPFVAATEERSEIPDPGLVARTVAVAPGVRLFRVSDELAASSLLDWSEPVQLKLEKRDDETYELIARRLPVGEHDNDPAF